LQELLINSRGAGGDIPVLTVVEPGADFLLSLLKTHFLGLDSIVIVAIAVVLDRCGRNG